ncbi:hypothetical protein [Methanobrevibacter sp.]|uniref:hypothetical protein n=1 Tax=Methanobrevibacter sp. TaxID=66852 RepID=UPI00388CF224
MSEFNLLRDFIERDSEKSQLLESLRQPVLRRANASILNSKIDAEKGCAEDRQYVEADLDDYRLCEPVMSVLQGKYCPKCGRKFWNDENFCPDCLVTLKGITDSIDIKSIQVDPHLEYVKSHSQENILTDENLLLINRFDFTIDDFNRVMFSIKAQAFRNLDSMIKNYDLDLDDLDVLDKVILFAKSFVHVEYKSYGGQLGYFEFNKIYVDDRQRNSLQITTLVHELTHFLVKEILTRIVCEILDCTKNEQVESIITYILSNSVFNNLIDEYAAHSVEGRFTIFGYQDYSSFLALQDKLDEGHVEIAKTIGNTFSIYIKELMEGFLDWDLRKEIKDQFLADTIERPNYSQLQFESCNKLSDEGFLKAIWLILTDGFQNVDMEVVDRYMEEFAKG